MQEFRPVKRRAAALLALLLAAAVLVCAASIRAYGLLYTSLDGRRIRSENGQAVNYFRLREQMFSGQADTRVSGWLSLAESEEVSIVSGRRTLAATRYAPLKRTQETRWALLLHGGLGTDRGQVLDVACMLSLSGYHVLTPDLAGHGQSEGEISSLGLRDADDVKKWIDWILAQDSGADIVLYGQDAGGVACLIAGKDMPHAVRAVIADSVYLSVEGRMIQLAEDVHGALSDFDRALLSAAYCAAHGVLAGDGQIETIVRDYPLPVMLIHGTGDEDVPAWHSEDIAGAAGKHAVLYLAEGAGHGRARYLDPKEYEKTVFAFLRTL